MVHRVSGIALALFLPLHFWALGNALQLEGVPRLDAAAAGEGRRVADRGRARRALGGGLRVLALEFLPWRDWQKSLAAAAAALAVAVGLAFALAL